RAVIAQQLQKGQGKFEVINYFADNYGEHMLGSPRSQGFGRLAMILPPLALVLGLIPLAFALRSRRSSHRKNSDSNVNVAPKTEDPRVAQALRDFDF
ncbi:MAG TPA: cytochrome c-type biogenesis protein CcmH, partial [Abditibacteriaceae bacterium]|nr:cytochrome c-type biogenesis protein CcmH [Abditibacteriaceae bacterium]